MFHVRWPKALSAPRTQSVGGLAMVALLAVSGWLWFSVFYQAPHRLAAQPAAECQKFKDMMDHSTKKASAIFDGLYEVTVGYDANNVPNGDVYNAWAAAMQRDAAQITGQGELAQIARHLADDSRLVADLVVRAGMDPSPDVDENHQDWVMQYNEISADFNIARNDFRVDCPGMQLGG
jgi:hypothetical protein